MAKVKINWPPMSMKAEGEDAAVLAQAEQFLKYVKEAHKISFDVLPTIFRDGFRFGAAPGAMAATLACSTWPSTVPARIRAGTSGAVPLISRNAESCSLASCEPSGSEAERKK